MDSLKLAYSSLPSAWLCLAVGSVVLVACCAVSEYRASCTVEDDFPTKRREPFLGSFDFFRDGFKFLLSCREWAHGGHMGFYILNVSSFIPCSSRSLTLYVYSIELLWFAGSLAVTCFSPKVGFCVARIC